MHYTEYNQIPGLLMLIDFEKAFDSIARKFIYQTLDFFNFGPSLKKWIETFYNGIKSCIIQNGVLSDYIFPQRGCKCDIETIDHLFFECFHVKELWCSIEDWILGKFNIHCSFDKQGILFGTRKYENKNIYRLQNILILVAKQFMFASKYKNVP
jgi:hypothetical protein